MLLLQIAAPFDEPGWLFEVKFDGFRALAYVENGEVQLVSRKGQHYSRFKDLTEHIASEVQAESAILDGELVYLDGEGRSLFYDLMFSRGQVYFYAFDLISVDGEDLRDLPLLERKQRLRRVVPDAAGRLLYLDHVEELSLTETCSTGTPR